MSACPHICVLIRVYEDTTYTYIHVLMSAYYYICVLIYVFSYAYMRTLHIHTYMSHVRILLYVSSYMCSHTLPLV